MDIATKIPLTLNERIDLEEALRVEATWEEFLVLLPQVEYRIEYDGRSIVSFMGFGSPFHELLSFKAGYLLGILLGLTKDFTIYSSNLAILNPEDAQRYFNSDCTVVQGPVELVSLRDTMQAISNPLILVEVLSPSTRLYDLTSKLDYYRKIDSLQQILYIDSQKLKVDSYQRLDNSSDWLLKTYDTTDQAITILDKGQIQMTELYHGVSFDDVSE